LPQYKIEEEHRRIDGRRADIQNLSLNGDRHPSERNRI
jgi:hypothetical protein